jgi:hypothetical protein
MFGLGDSALGGPSSSWTVYQLVNTVHLAHVGRGANAAIVVQLILLTLIRSHVAAASVLLVGTRLKVAHGTTERAPPSQTPPCRFPVAGSSSRTLWVRSGMSNLRRQQRVCEPRCRGSRIQLTGARELGRGFRMMSTTAWSAAICQWCGLDVGSEFWIGEKL